MNAEDRRLAVASAVLAGLLQNPGAMGAPPAVLADVAASYADALLVRLTKKPATPEAPAAS